MFKNYTECAVFAWLCDAAAWQGSPVFFNGVSYPVERGQVVTSASDIATKFDVSLGQIKRLLKRMTDGQLIDLQTNNRRTYITICNYDKYQGLGDTLRSTDEQPDVRSTIDPIYKAKEDKEGKEDKDCPPAPQNDFVTLPFDTLPVHWLHMAVNEKGWPCDVVQDVWVGFSEHWMKESKTKRGKKSLAGWDAAWRNWFRKENIRAPYAGKPLLAENDPWHGVEI